MSNKLTDQKIFTTQGYTFDANTVMDLQIQTGMDVTYILDELIRINIQKRREKRIDGILNNSK